MDKASVRHARRARRDVLPPARAPRLVQVVLDPLRRRRRDLLLLAGLGHAQVSRLRKVRPALACPLRVMVLGAVRDLPPHRRPRAAGLLPRFRFFPARSAARRCSRGCRRPRQVVRSASDLGVGRLLQDVSARPVRERLPDVLWVVLHRQDEDLGLGPLVQERRDDVEPALIRHDDVHEDHVGLQRTRLEHGVTGTSGLPHGFEVGLRVDQQLQPGAEDGVVVDDEHAHAHASGTSATRVVPAPATTRPRGGRRAGERAHGSRRGRGARARPIAGRSRPVVLDHGPRPTRCFAVTRRC